MCNDENGGKFKTKLFLAEINALCLPWAKNTHSASLHWRLNEENSQKSGSKQRSETKRVRGRETKSKKEHIGVWGKKIPKDIQTAYCVRVFICVWIVDVVDGDAFTQRYVHTVSCERTKETFVIDFCFWFLLKNFPVACAKQWWKRCEMNCLLAYYCHVWEFDHFAFNHFNRNQSSSGHVEIHRTNWTANLSIQSAMPIQFNALQVVPNKNVIENQFHI